MYVYIKFKFYHIFLNIEYIVSYRVVHESGWIRFGLNLHPTQADRVENISTCCQPKRLIGLGLQLVVVGLVHVIVAKIG